MYDSHLQGIDEDVRLRNAHDDHFQPVGFLAYRFHVIHIARARCSLSMC